MNQLINELKDCMILLPHSNDKIYPFVNEVDGCRIYGYNDGEIGIFVEYENAPLNYRESFSGIVLHSSMMKTADGLIRGLKLGCTDPDNVGNAFLHVCESFTHPVTGSLKDLLNHPYDWVDEWKEILGNSISSKPTYQIMGELMALG